MSSLKSILSISLLLTNSATVLASLPATSTSSSTYIFNNATATAASPITPVPIHCDITYCVNGTSYCHFWAGISTWHISGPSPGELSTTLGACKVGRARMTAV